MKNRNFKKLNLITSTVIAAGLLSTFSLSTPKNYTKAKNQNSFEGHNQNATVDFSTWMKNVPDERKITNLSIPGTHDSAMFDGTGPAWVFGRFLAQTQVMNFAQQLKAGIRFFDIRVRYQDGNFWLTHGAAFASTGLLDFLREVKKFLQTNPSETVLFRIKEENGSVRNDNANRQWSDRLLNALRSSEFRDLFFNYGNKPSAYVPTLKELRGKALMFNHFHHLITTTREFGPLFNDGSFDRMFLVQDRYENVNENSKTEAYITSQNIIANNSKTNSGDFFYINFVSWANGSSPWNNARKTMPKIYDFLKKNQQFRVLGIVPMDFPSSAIIEEILKRNYSWSEEEIKQNHYSKLLTNVFQTTPSAGDNSFNITLSSNNNAVENIYLDINVERTINGQKSIVYNEQKRKLTLEELKSLKIILNKNNFKFNLNDILTVKYRQILPANDYYNEDVLSEYTRKSTVSGENAILKLIRALKTKLNLAPSINKITSYNSILQTKIQEMNNLIDQIDITVDNRNTRNKIANLSRKIDFLNNNLLPALNNSNNIVSQLKNQKLNHLNSNNSQIREIFERIFNQILNLGIENNKTILNSNIETEWIDSQINKIENNFQKISNKIDPILDTIKKIEVLSIPFFEQNIRPNQTPIYNSYKIYITNEINSIKNTQVVNLLSNLSLDNISEVNQKLEELTKNFNLINERLSNDKNLLDEINNFLTIINTFIKQSKIESNVIFNNSKIAISEKLKTLTIFNTNFVNSLNIFTNEYLKTTQEEILKSLNLIFTDLKNAIGFDNKLRNQIVQQIDALGNITIQNYFWKLSDSHFLNNFNNIIKIINKKEQINNIFLLDDLIEETLNKLNNNNFNNEDGNTINNLILEIKEFHNTVGLITDYYAITSFVTNDSYNQKEKEYLQNLTNLIQNSKLNNEQNLNKELINKINKNIEEISQIILNNQNLIHQNYLNFIQTDINTLKVTLNNDNETTLNAKLNNLSDLNKYLKDQNNINKLKNLTSKFENLNQLILNNKLNQSDYSLSINNFLSLLNKHKPSFEIIEEVLQQLENNINQIISKRNSLKIFIENNKIQLFNLLNENIENSIYKEIENLTELSSQIQLINDYTSVNTLEQIRDNLILINDKIDLYKQINSIISTINEQHTNLLSINDVINSNKLFENLKESHKKLINNYSDQIKQINLNQLINFQKQQQNLINKFNLIRTQNNNNDFKEVQITFVLANSNDEIIQTNNLIILKNGQNINLTTLFNTNNYSLNSSQEIEFISESKTFKLTPKYKLVTVNFVNENKELILSKTHNINYNENQINIKNLIPDNYSLKDQQTTYTLNNNNSIDIVIIKNQKQINLKFIDINHPAIPIHNQIIEINQDQKIVDLTPYLPSNYLFAPNQPNIVSVENLIDVLLVPQQAQYIITFINSENSQEINRISLNVSADGQTFDVSQFIDKKNYQLATNQEENVLINGNLIVYLIPLFKEVKISFVDNFTNDLINEQILNINRNGQKINLLNLFDNQNYQLAQTDQNEINIDNNVTIKLIPLFKIVTLNLISQNTVDTLKIRISSNLKELMISDYLPKFYKLSNLKDNQQVIPENNLIDVKVTKNTKEVKLTFKNLENNIVEIKNIEIDYDANQINLNDYLPTDFELINSENNIVTFTNEIEILVKDKQKSVQLSFVNEFNKQLINIVNVNINTRGQIINLNNYFDTLIYKLTNQEDNTINIIEDKVILLQPLKKEITFRFIDENTFSTIGLPVNLSIAFEQNEIDIANYLPENYYIDNSIILLNDQILINVVIKNKQQNATIYFVNNNGNIISSVNQTFDFKNKEINILELLPQGYILVNENDAKITLNNSVRINVIKNSKTIELKFIDQTTNELISNRFIEITLNGQNINLNDYFKNADYQIITEQSNEYFVNNNTNILVKQNQQSITLNFVDNENQVLIKSLKIKISKDDKEIDLNNYLPQGYELIDTNKVNVKNNLTIALKALTRKINLQFKIKETNQIITNKIITISQNDQSINLLSYIPDDYLLDYNNNQIILAITDEQKEAIVYILKSAKSITLTFKNAKDNQTIKQERIDLANNNGQIIDLSLYFDYQLYTPENNNLYIFANEDKEIKLMQRSRYITINFIDENNLIIKQSKLRINLEINNINLISYLPEGYQTIDNQNLVNITDKEIIEVKVLKDQKPIQINFHDAQGNILQTTNNEVNRNDVNIDLRPLLNDNLELATYQNPIVLIQDTINAMAKYKTNNYVVTFVNKENNEIISKRTLSLKINGELVNLMTLFDQNNFRLVDTENEVLIAQDLTVNLMPNYKNVKVKFIDAQSLNIVHEEIIKVSAFIDNIIPSNILPTNYQFNKDNTYNINENNELNVLIDKNKINLTISLETLDKQIIRQFNHSINFDQKTIDTTAYIPHNYELVNSDDQTMLVNSNKVIIKIKEKTKKINIDFINYETNLSIGKANLEIKITGEQINLNNYFDNQNYELIDKDNNSLFVTNDLKINVVLKEKFVILQYVDFVSQQVINNYPLDKNTINNNEINPRIGLPNNYELIDNNLISYNNESSIKILIKQTKREITIVFVDQDSKKELIRFNKIVELSNDILDLSNNLPENYEFKTTSKIDLDSQINLYTIELIDKNKIKEEKENQNIEQPIQNENQRIINVIFIDQNNKEIKQEELTLDQNQTTIDLTSLIPQDYQLLDDHILTLNSNDTYKIVIKNNKEKDSNAQELESNKKIILDFVLSNTQQKINSIELSINKNGQEIDLSSYFDTKKYITSDSKLKIFVKENQVIYLHNIFKLRVSFYDENILIQNAEINIPTRANNEQLKNALEEYVKNNLRNYTFSKDNELKMNKTSNSLEVKITRNNNNNDQVVIQEKSTNKTAIIVGSILSILAAIAAGIAGFFYYKKKNKK
ncbi:hypothetical protein VBM87_02210 [Mycoplasma sp. 744]|uniref:hypothetical protein n=1 Tax=Mycoplasma sp. 744 TaxID=3108531 RepID=UPI002B1CFE5B|nr:hypothetical protein [Mycoplasma sp. 744]MEA4115585.1 hypothetical protein [Mycoplasma sp. 744]